MKNKVDVILSGKDDLSGVLNKASTGIGKLVSFGKLFTGVGLAIAFGEAAKKAAELAGEVSGDFSSNMEYAKDLMGGLVLSVLETTNANQLFSQGLTFLSERVLPLLLTYLRWATDAFKFMVDVIVEGYNRYLKPIFDGIGGLLSRFVPDAVKNTASSLVDWANAEVAVSKEILNRNTTIVASTRQLQRYTDTVRNFNAEMMDIAARVGIPTISKPTLPSLLGDTSSTALLDNIIEKDTRTVTQRWFDAREEIRATIANDTTLSEAIYTSFSAAFSGEGLGGLFKNFGSIILSGLGDIIASMGRSILAFSQLMSKFAAAVVTNPIFAGPIGIAAGIAMIALGGALGGIARGGGSSGGFSSGSPLRGTPQSFNNLGDSLSKGEAVINIRGGLLDMSDARQARALQNALSELSGRRVTIVGA